MFATCFLSQYQQFHCFQNVVRRVLYLELGLPQRYTVSIEGMDK